MYKILVVDDEAVEREVVLFLIKKYQFPLSVKEADNGKTALELIQKEEFHILFTDIKMPYISGIDLANKARELYPELHIIFFSGYDDFEYVKEALSLHVVNYILKPVNPEEFQKTISATMQEISKCEQLHQKNNEIHKLERNHILSKLLNNVGIEELNMRYSHFDLSFLYDYHLLFLVNFIDTLNVQYRLSELQEILPENCDLVSLSRDQAVILFYGQKHRMQWYQQMADQLTKRMYMEYQVDCYIAISSSIEKPKDLVKALEKAQTDLIQSSFFTNHEPSGENATVVSAKETDPRDVDSLLDLLQNDIKCKNAYLLKQHMILLIHTCKNRKMHSHIYVRFLSTNAIKLLLDGLSEKTDERFDEYVQAVYNYKHFTEIECLLKQLTNQLAESFTEESQYTKHALQMVKHYIKNHYDGDLSLEILANEVCLSPSYLSSIFIEENGYGINKYIRDVRMSKAKELLLNTNMKIKDISQKVGYQNLSYFCKSFAKEYGITPERFRKHPPEDERK